MRVFLALLACAVSLCAAGGRRYPVPQEVGHILGMVQDTQGYVWVGAEKGLFRFDGNRFQPVGQWAGLPAEPVSVVLYAHSDGAVWMGLPSGLYRLRGARAERIDERPVTDAAWLASGLIAATPGVGLVYWYSEQRQWKRVVESISPVPTHVHPTPAYNGVTYAQGPALQRATWTGSSLHLTTEPVAGAAGEWREALLREDYLLLGSATEYAIAKRRGGVWTVLSRHAAPITGKRMIALENAPVTIRGETLTLFSNGKQHARQAMSPSVVQPLRHSLFALYLSDYREFLHYSLGNSSVQFGPEFGVREPQAMRLTGGKWLVAGRTGVASIEKDNPDCERFPFTWTACPWVATKETIHDVRIGANGQIWALSRETGVVRLDRARGVVERLELPEGMRPADLLLLAEASDGRLFAGSTQGMLALQQSGGEARLERVEGFGYTANFASGADGTLWAVADGKIARYRNGAWTSMPVPGCLPSPQLQSLAVESTQSLWISYRADLGFTNLRQDTQAGTWRCEHYTAREGFSPVIKWLIIDQLGRLWAAGDRRIFVTQLETGKRPHTTEDWVSVGAAEGLGPGELLPYGATKQEDGAMWVTTTEGVTLFPHGFLRAAEPPVVSVVERTGGIDWLSPGGWVGERRGRARALYLTDITMPVGASSRRPLWRYVGRNGEQSAYQPIVDGRVPLDGVPEDVALIEFQRRDGAALGSFAIPPGRSEPWRSRGAAVFLSVCAAVLGALVWWGRSRWLDRVTYWREEWRVWWRSAEEEEESRSPYLLAPGQRLRNRYVVEEILARGGFSEVYRATDLLNPSFPVALKALSMENAMRPDYRAWMHSRFLEELKALRSVDHPCLIKLLDAWWEDGTPCLAMPLVNGITLRDLLQREGRLRQEVVAGLVRDLGWAIRAAHRRGVTHGDIKPENILITGSGPETWRPVVIDFGTSRLRQEASLMRRDRYVAGTRLYMAPEQALGMLVEASDVWALALTTMEMLTGGPGAADASGIEDPGVRKVFASAFVEDPGVRAADAAAWAEELAQLLLVRAGH